MGKRRPCTVEQKRERDVLASKQRDVSFCKRRKASKLCSEHGTRIAVLVLSPRGKPYAFGHTSVDEVLNQYFNVQQEQEPQQSRASVINEERNMVECMKEGIENELKACQTVHDFAMLRERLRELYEKTNERLNNSSSSDYIPVFEEDHIMYGRRSSGTIMMSPNYLSEPAPCPLPSSSTHGPCLNGGPTSGYGNYVVDNHAYYGKNNNGDDGSSWGFEYVENIMPNSLSQRSSSSTLSPNFFDPIPNFSTHVLSVDAHLNSSDGNYIRGGHAYGNNSYGSEESSWGTECIENVGIGNVTRLSSNNSLIVDSPCPLPNISAPVLSRDCRDDQAYGEDMCGEGSYNILQNMERGHDPDDNVNNPFEATINLSGSLSTGNSLFMDSTYPLPINTSPIPSREGSTDDQAYGSDISSWEGSYEVLGNIGLGQDDPDNDNSFGSTIYLPGHLCSNPPFPTCPSPSISGAGHHDLDDEDVPFDVSSPGAMVCPPTNGALFVPLIGSSSTSVKHNYITTDFNYFDMLTRSSSDSAQHSLTGHCNYFDTMMRATTDSAQHNAYQWTMPLLRGHA